MNPLVQADIINYTIQAVGYVLLASIPPVLAAAVVGVLVSLLQALTQIQEQTLPFLFKFIAVVITLFVIFASVGAEFGQFTNAMFTRIAEIR